MPLNLTLDDESLPLTRSIANENFPQQGQIDWVSLSRGTINFSFGVLSRLSAASVDPYTLSLGHFIGSNFQFSCTGRQNIEQTLRGLKSFGGVGDVLWFGFGVKHLIRAISVTEQGAMLVALCATLAECFPDEISAEVLSHLAKGTADLKVVPSLSEWRSLVRCCAGTVATTPFPLRAETLMGVHVGIATGSSVGNPDPHGLAETLLGIGKLSRGVWKSITITGPREVGWIAAVAEWLFGLTVTILNEDGDVKYSSSRIDHVASIIILPENTSETVGKAPMLHVVDKSFELRTALDLFNLNSSVPLGGDNVTRICGRVKWHQCLHAAFGIHFEKLMTMKTTFCEIFASASRVFKAIANCNKDIQTGDSSRNRLYTDRSFGIGLIQHSANWLPELSPAASTIQNCYDNTPDAEARSKYEARLALLAVSCKCRLCDPPKSRVRKDDADLRCLVVITETIIVLCRLLSTLELVESPFPLLRGIQKLYGVQATRRCRFRDQETDMGAVVHILDDPRVEGTAPLLAALSLFAGRSALNLDKNVIWPCAVSAGGICVYLNTLHEPSDDKEVVNQICVVPGQIECNEKPFYCVEDWPYSNENLSRWLDGQAECRMREPTGDERWTKMTNSSLMCSVKVEVKETVRSLAIRYNIMDDRNQPTHLSFSPMLLAQGASHSRGLVHCPESHRVQPMVASGSPSEELLKRLEETGITFRLLKAPVLGRCAALTSFGHNLILQENECLDCCIKSALSSDSTEIIVISQTERGSASDSVFSENR